MECVLFAARKMVCHCSHVAACPSAVVVFAAVCSTSCENRWTRKRRELSWNERECVCDDSVLRYSICIELQNISLNLFTTNSKLKHKTQLKSHYKHTLHTHHTCTERTNDTCKSGSTTMAIENFVKHSRAIFEFIIFTHCLLWFYLDPVHTLSSSIAFRHSLLLHLPATLFGVSV